MNFTLTIDATPRLENLLTGFIGALLGGTAPAKTETPVKAIEKPAKALKAETPPVTEGEKTVTLETIRLLMSDKRDTKGPQIKDLLKEFNAAKLTGLDKDSYPDFYTKLQAL